MLTDELLKERLYAGPVADIVHARRAYSIVRTIGEHVSEVNNPARNFGELFATLQAQASDTALLHTARIFDRPSDQYPTVSIRSILRDLKLNAGVLPFRDTYNAGCELRDLGMQEAVVATTMGGTSTSITLGVVAFVEGMLESESVKRKLAVVKAMRDTRIAHHEMFIGPFDALSWEGVLSLVRLAESIVTVVGSGYTTTVFGQDGRFILADDAERPSLGLLRLMEKAGIIAPRHPPAGPQGSQER